MPRPVASVVLAALLLLQSASGSPISVIARAEPTIPPSPGPRHFGPVVLVNATIAADGTVADARATISDRVFAPLAVEAVRAWRFRTSTDAPVSTVIGINFTRSDEPGAAIEPVAVGGKGKTPRTLGMAAGVYPSDAQVAPGRPGVTVELTLDAGGVPIDAISLQPVDAMTPRAVDAALHWRFEPDKKVPRRLVQVSVPFEPEVGFGPPRSAWPQTPRNAAGLPVVPPRKIADAKPRYTADAVRNRIQGEVAIDALIGVDGSVEAAVVVRSLPFLGEAAVEAVRQWKFTPTLLDGKPVPTRMTVTVNFALQ